MGKRTSQTGSTENPYTWVGELGYYQNPDGSYTLRRRDYTAEENRFRSEDPIGTNSGESNLYWYVGNSPVNATDPSGLDSLLTLSMDSKDVYWNFEQTGGYLWNDSCGKIRIGTKLSSTQVLLDAKFGHCVVGLGTLRSLIESSSGAGLCNVDAQARDRIVTDRLKHQICGSGNGLPDDPPPSFCKAPLQGSYESLVVWFDQLTLHMVCPEEARRIQESAIERGDVLSQIGFGCGKVSATALQTAGFLKLLQGAAGASEGVAYTLKLLTPIFAYGASVNTVKESYKAAEGIDSGNYIQATESAGNAIINLAFVVDMAALTRSGLLELSQSLPSPKLKCGPKSCPVPDSTGESPAEIAIAEPANVKTGRSPQCKIDEPVTDPTYTSGLKTGDLYERSFQTSKGPVGLLAEVEINGKTLWLKDITVYPEASSDPLTGLEKEVFSARRQIMEEARCMGYDKLRLTYKRHENSTSANPGKIVDITINLR